MKRVLILVVTLALAVPVILQASQASSSEEMILSFGTMAAVRGPFVGSANPIRGIAGGGLPWKIRSAQGGIASDGRVRLQVRGLVLVNRAPVPPALQGTNPVPLFQAIVSCLSINKGKPSRINLATASFPATTNGNSNIQATVHLPEACFAPMVFVGPSPTTWFAVTGRA